MFNEDFTKGLPNIITTSEGLTKTKNRLDDIAWKDYSVGDGNYVIANPKYISIYDKTNRRTQLYELIDEFKWKKISLLGKNGNLFEINPYKDIIKSNLRNNNPNDNVIEENNKPIKNKYPELPFVVKDEYNELFMVVYDENSDKYGYIYLTGENNEKGRIHRHTFDTLDEMFKRYSDDKIMISELKIIGEY
jgi:hypothetical protein